MPQTELFLIFLRLLNRAGFRYVIGGSVASIFYGEPRMTDDVDLVVFLNDADIQRLPEVFPRAEFYLPPEEVIRAEVARPQRGHFNIIHSATSFKADVYPTGRNELNAWAFRNKRSVPFQRETLVLAPPEYVIVRKLEYFREGGSEKHLRDIRECSMCRASNWITPRSMSGLRDAACRRNGSGLGSESLPSALLR